MEWNAPAPEELETPKELHPAGNHKALCVGAEAAKTRNGKDMIKFTFKTAHGKLHGRLVYSPESETARRMWFRQLGNLGVTKEVFDYGPEVDELALHCVKAEVLLRVQHEEYDGATRAAVSYIDAVPAVKVVPA